MYIFKLCDRCGKDLKVKEVNEIPTKYSYYQTINNEKYYCLGYTPSVFCRACCEGEE